MSTSQKVIISIVVIAAAIAIGYGLYILYEIVMTDVTLRIKEAIAEGIHEGLGSVVNPLNWAQEFMQR